MRDFWDARARENAFYYVDNRVDYRDPDRVSFWDGGRRSLEAILERTGAEIGPGDRVVEIGCGVGRVTRWLAARAAEVVAVDVSEEMLARAMALNPELANVTWLLGDGRSLEPVEDGAADVVFSDVVFQHIPDPEVQLGYVREIGRVLRPSGWAAFQVSNDRRVHVRRPLAERLRTRIRGALRRGPRAQEHPAWLGAAVDLDELRRVAGAAGMDLERVAGEGTQHCHVLLRRRG